MEDHDNAVETEELEVAGQPVAIELKKAENVLTVNIPEGLSEEQQQEIKQRIESGEVSALVKAYHRKNQEYNEKLKHLDYTQPKEEQKAPDPQPTSTAIKPVWERMGLKAESELEDAIVDNPSLYHKHMEEYYRDTAKAEAQSLIDAKLGQFTKTVAMQSLEAQAKAKGLDVEDAKKFAEYYGMPFNERALALYESRSMDKTNPVYRAQVEAQQRQINYVPQKHHVMTVNPTTDQIKGMSDEELDAYYASRKSQIRG